MSDSLTHVWKAAAGSPFYPVIGKGLQFPIGFTLLALGVILSGLFGLNRTIANLPLLAVPAALCYGFGAVIMICAVGVYV